MYRKSFAVRVSFGVLFGLSLMATALFQSGDVSKANPSPPAFVPAVTITKSAALVAGNGDADADPGDTIEYTVTVNNTAGAGAGNDATGVQISDTLQAIQTLVGGSLAVSPIAVNDSYSAAGNVRLSVADGVGDLLGNDINPGGGALTIVAPVPTVSANGGNVSINTANGSFTYNPAPGFEGIDSFTYTLSNGSGMTDTATVTINVSGMIWFINNNAPACTTLAAGCGRLSNPFSNIAAFQAINNGTGNNPAANDNIFVYESAIAYVGPLTLLNGQKFIGQDATATLSTISGVTPPAGSDPLPAMNSGNGTIVEMTSAGIGITLAQNNTLRGFTGGNAAPDITGTGFGTLNVSDVTLNGTGQALSLSTGTLNGTFGSITSTNSATTGMSLTSVAGNLTTGSTTITNPNGIGISVASSSGTFNFANTTLNDSSGAGVFLNSNSGAITFGSLNINTDTNVRAFHATSNTGAITTTGGTIADTGNATAVEIVGVSAANRTPLNVQLTSVSANGAASGIILTSTSSTGSPGGFRVLGNGGSCTSSATCTGGAIQNTTGHGILLTNTLDPSFTRIAVQNTSASGIEGTGVTNFTLQNSFINNSGTGGGADDSNVAFNSQAAGTENNISGIVTITNNTLTNARWHGIMLQNFNGTISDAVITGNTITSSTLLANSLGSGINLQILGSATTVSHLTKANISNNTITNFPSGAGIQVQGGNSNAAGSNGTVGVAGHATNIITITGNFIRGESAVNRMNTSAILFTVSGKGQGNVAIDSNGTLANPLAHTTGTTIGVGANGNTTLTATTNNNFIESNHPSNGGTGISGGAGVTFGSSDTPNMTWTINNNVTNNTDGNGILAVARGVTGTLKIAIKNNNIEAPMGGVRPGIRVDAGNNLSVDDAVCLDISGNVSAGSGGHPGIGLRKQGTNPTTHDFGIEGMAATSSPGVEAFVNGQNPAGNGTLLISATSGFSNCSSAPFVETACLFTPKDANTSDNNLNFLKVPYQSPSEILASIGPVIKTYLKPEIVSTEAIAPAEIETAIETPETDSANGSTFLSDASDLLSEIASKLSSAIQPTIYSQEKVAPEGVADVSVGPFTLPAGESITVRFQATVNNGPFASGVNAVTNQASVSGSNFTTVGSNTTSIDLDAAPDLVVTKTEGGGNTEPGGIIAYTLNYSNTTAVNGQDAVNVALTETVPMNATFNASGSSPGWSCADNSPSGTACTFSVGSLAAGSSNSATFAVRVLDALPAGATAVSNTAGLNEAPNVNGTDRVPGDNSAADSTPIIGNWDGSNGAAGFGDWTDPLNWSNDVVPTGNVSIPNVANQPLVNTVVTVDNIVLNGEDIQITAPGVVMTDGNVTLGANFVNGDGMLDLGPSSQITRTAGHVNAVLSKDFAANGPFTFHVGTPGAYSPVQVNVTAGTGPLSVKANTGTAPATPVLNPLTTLQRFWTMNGSGITADVTFNYLDGDVAGNEANYWVIRVSGGSPLAFGSSAGCPPAGACVTPAANTIFVAGLDSFSDWTAGELAPTAAGVTVSGRVLSTSGRPISRAFVTITDPVSGLHHQAFTNTFGHFRFTDIPAGNSYVLSVMHGRFVFDQPTQLIDVSDNVSDIVFTGRQP